MQWDLIVRNAKVFDGTGAPGRVGDMRSVRAKSQHGRALTQPASSSKSLKLKTNG